MGYTTYFTGSIKLSRKLKEHEAAYLAKLSTTRRMKRDESECENYHDPIRESVGLPIGVEGEYCIFGAGWAGQDTDSSVVDHNTPPRNQPGLWLQWELSSAKNSFKWNGGEKFYSYTDWLFYLHDFILIKWGVTYTTSNIKYKGEQRDDKGSIIIEDGYLIQISSNGNIEEKFKLADVVFSIDEPKKEPKKISKRKNTNKLISQEKV